MGIGVAAAPSAEAQVVDNCPAWTVCLYEHWDLSGRQFNYSPDWGASRVPDRMDNKTTGIVNRTGYHMCFYQYRNRTGVTLRIGPWETWRPVPWWINNKISSLSPC